MQEIKYEIGKRYRTYRGEERSIQRVGKPEGRRPPERPRHRRKDNTETDLRGVG
jgi:hypothetical protein